MNLFLVTQLTQAVWEDEERCIQVYPQWSYSLVLLISIPSAVFTISNTVWLGKRWKGSNSHCVCAQTAWSAVLSYRKSRGRPPLVICAGEGEHDLYVIYLHLFLHFFSCGTSLPLLSSTLLFLPLLSNTAFLRQPHVLSSVSSHSFPAFHHLSLTSSLEDLVKGYNGAQLVPV